MTEQKQFCYDYPRPALTVDAAVFRRHAGVTEVLLIQRKNYPFEGMWALPGGFVDMDETCETAVVRELEEETHLQANELKQLHTFSALGRDPRGRTVSVTFYGTVDFDKSSVKGGDDAADARWFTLDNMPPLAFDHIEAVMMASKRLQ
ncbi:MAG: NUDIX hydrolase [Bacteroidales bacterium]|nr:NUDIX hydrolase [Bacteroidales bacterium]